MTKQLVVDPKLCKACRTCELACSFQHHGEFNPRLAAVTVFYYEKEAVSIPLMCLQCEEAYCAKICPTGALTRTEDGVITHDESKCLVCKMCVNACPLGNISFSPVTRKVFKCDQCGGEALCAQMCPTHAIAVVDPTDVPDKKKLAADRLKATVEEA